MTMDVDDRYKASLTDEGHYRILLDAITDCAIYMLNREGVVVSWNAGARRLKGYDAAEIVGENFARFYAPEEREAGLPQQALKTAVREGKFAAEGWRVRKNGSRFWASVVIYPIRAPLGALVGYAKITRDITEQRAAQEALWRSEERFRLLVQGVTEYAVYMLDPEGLVYTWNSGAERISGYSAEDIIGEPFSTFYTAADRAAGKPAMALETAASEGRLETQAWRVRKDGTLLWGNIVIDAIRDLTGSLIGFAMVIRDISDRYAVPAGLREPAPEAPQPRRA